MDLPDGEPRFGPWRARPVADLLGDALGVDVRRARPSPLLLAVDGRSGSGKTTVARRILDGVPGAAVVHTDDIAWYHAMFDWAALMADGVLAPLRRGGAVAYRPVPRGRTRGSARTWSWTARQRSRTTRRPSWWSPT